MACRRMSNEEISICACYPIPVDGQHQFKDIDNIKKSVAIDSDHENEPLNVDKGVYFGGCGHECLNRLSYIHCDPKVCPCGVFCRNKPFYKLKTPEIEVFLTETKGWGVRAKEAIPQGTFLVEYVGEVVEEAEMKKRMEASKANKESHFYMMEMSPGLVIDARPKGNISRLLNSSCDPNCVSQKWHDGSTGEVRVGLFTKREIAPGEELVYDYKFQHLLDDEGNSKYTCQCGAVNCRGSMETTQRQGLKDVGRRIEVWWDGDSCYYPGKIINYSPQSGKYGILYDDGWKEEILLREHMYRWQADQSHACKRKKKSRGADKAQETQELQLIMVESDGGEAGPSGDHSLVNTEEDLQKYLRPDAVNMDILQHLIRQIDSTIPDPAGNESAALQLHEFPVDHNASVAGQIWENMLDTWKNLTEEECDKEKMNIRAHLSEALANIVSSPPPEILEPVENPGAEQTAGSLHGNGNGKDGSPPASVSLRGRKRQKKIFGNDFEQDIDLAQKSGRQMEPPPLSPPSDKSRGVSRKTPLSPGIEAASIIAQMANASKSDVDKPGARSRTSHKRSGPTPPSSGLPARTILVAKRLTNSDVSKGRVLLPRAAVEANLSFAVGRAHSLMAKDHDGNTWEFTLQSWANGIETRRVFVLEHAGEYLRHHGLKIEDVIGISTTAEGEFMVEYNTEEVCSAAESQQAARAGGQSAAVNTSLPAIMPGSINPLIQKNSGRCTRSVHCNKPAGHPGFCMRTPAAAKGKKPMLRRGRGRMRGRRSSISTRIYYDSHSQQESYEVSEEDTYAGRSNADSGAEQEPGSARYRRQGEMSGGEDDIFKRGGVLTPRFPNSAYEYFGSAKQEQDYDDCVDDGHVSTGGKEYFASNTSSKGPQLPKYPLPPPPELGPGVPPIFVMAQDSIGPQLPPQLRSPLRPSILGRQQQSFEHQHQQPNTASNAARSQPIPSSPSAGAFGTLPSIPMDDIAEGVSPHAFHSNDLLRMAALSGNNSDILSILEGSSPTAARFDMAGAGPLGSTSNQQGKVSQPGMPAAPLPLFGAPPPPLVGSQVKGASASQQQASTSVSRDKNDFDYTSFLNNSGNK